MRTPFRGGLPAEEHTSERSVLLPDQHIPGRSGSINGGAFAGEMKIELLG
jgi:hypothetical protein